MRARAILAVAIAAAAFAQGPPPERGLGRGRMGLGGPGEIGPRFLGAEAAVPGRVVKNAPYSAELTTESVQTLPDGNHIRQSSTVKVYRDSEGRTRREQSVNLNGLASNSNMPQLVFINDPVGGVNYVLNVRERTGTRSTWTGGGGRMGRGAPPREPMPKNTEANSKTESLGRQTVEGVAADGRRVTMTIAAGQMGNDQPIQIVTETWFSPDLQIIVYSKRSDPRSGDTSTRMVNINRSEPARNLFDPPADYKVTEAQRRFNPASR